MRRSGGGRFESQVVAGLHQKLFIVSVVTRVGVRGDPEENVEPSWIGAAITAMTHPTRWWRSPLWAACALSSHWRDGGRDAVGWWRSRDCMLRSSWPMRGASFTRRDAESFWSGTRYWTDSIFAATNRCSTWVVDVGRSSPPSRSVRQPGG